MRYDQRIAFVKMGARKYDEVTGDYEELSPVKLVRSAHVSDTGLERMNFLYGKVVEHAKTVRIQGTPPADFDYIEIGEDLYSATLTRALRHETIYQVRKKQ